MDYESVCSRRESNLMVVLRFPTLGRIFYDNEYMRMADNGYGTDGKVSLYRKKYGTDTCRAFGEDGCDFWVR